MILESQKKIPSKSIHVVTVGRNLLLNESTNDMFSMFILGKKIFGISFPKLKKECLMENSIFNPILGIIQCNVHFVTKATETITT